MAAGQRCQAESLRLLEWPAVCRQVASFSATPMAAEQALAGAIPLADSQAAAELLLQVGLLGIAALHKAFNWNGLCCIEVRQTSWQLQWSSCRCRVWMVTAAPEALRPCCLGAVTGPFFGGCRSDAQRCIHWLQKVSCETTSFE